MGDNLPFRRVSSHTATSLTGLEREALEETARAKTPHHHMDGSSHSNNAQLSPSANWAMQLLEMMPRDAEGQQIDKAHTPPPPPRTSPTSIPGTDKPSSSSSSSPSYSYSSSSVSSPLATSSTTPASIGRVGGVFSPQSLINSPLNSLNNPNNSNNNTPSSLRYSAGMEARRQRLTKDDNNRPVGSPLGLPLKGSGGSGAAGGGAAAADLSVAEANVMMWRNIEDERRRQRMQDEERERQQEEEQMMMSRSADDRWGMMSSDTFDDDGEDDDTGADGDGEYTDGHQSDGIEDKDYDGGFIPSISHSPPSSSLPTIPETSSSITILSPPSTQSATNSNNSSKPRGVISFVKRKSQKLSFGSSSSPTPPPPPHPSSSSSLSSSDHVSSADPKKDKDRFLPSIGFKKFNTKVKGFLAPPSITNTPPTAAPNSSSGGIPPKKDKPLLSPFSSLRTKRRSVPASTSPPSSSSSPSETNQTVVVQQQQQQQQQAPSDPSVPKAATPAGSSNTSSANHINMDMLGDLLDTLVKEDYTGSPESNKASDTSSVATTAHEFPPTATTSFSTETFVRQSKRNSASAGDLSSMSSSSSRSRLLVSGDRPLNRSPLGFQMDDLPSSTSAGAVGTTGSPHATAAAMAATRARELSVAHIRRRQEISRLHSMVSDLSHLAAGHQLTMGVFHSGVSTFTIDIIEEANTLVERSGAFQMAVAQYEQSGCTVDSGLESIKSRLAQSVQALDAANAHMKELEGRVQVLQRAGGLSGDWVLGKFSRLFLAITSGLYYVISAFNFTWGRLTPGGGRHASASPNGGRVVPHAVTEDVQGGHPAEGSKISPDMGLSRDLSPAAAIILSTGPAAPPPSSVDDERAVDEEEEDDEDDDEFYDAAS